MINNKTKKIYCIYNYKVKTRFINVNFKKGNIYNVIYCDNDIFTPIHIYDDDFGILQIHPDSPFNKKINKYFLTEKEIRKIKLEKLNK